MKKIMFNDRYGLTEAVLTGRKTMTRRTAYDKPMKYEKRMGWDKDGYLLLLDGWEVVAKSRYRLNEFVAVAQSHHTLNKMGFVAPEWCEHTCEDSAGYKNKMFVRADLMPHRIRITDIKVERLRDISDEDCLREGIIGQTFGMFTYVTYSQYVDMKPEERERFCTPRSAFAALIDKVSGRGTWERNPWEFAYSFELVQ